MSCKFRVIGFLTDISLLMRFYKSLFQGDIYHRVTRMIFGALLHNIWRVLPHFLRARGLAVFGVRLRDIWRALTQYLACAHAIFGVRSSSCWHYAPMS